MPAQGLIADIGGTNARFALVEAGTLSPQSPLVMPCADFAGPAEAAAAYLDRVAPKRRPTAGVFAVAGPISGDAVAMTNHAWSFSTEAVRQTLGLDSLAIVNDFLAQALAVPHLAPEHLERIGGRTGIPAAPIAVLGPGTGLGVAILVPNGESWLPVACEGGHATLAASDEREAAIIAWLRGRHGHVSVERVLSGPGLVNLHAAILALDGSPPAPLAPADISRLAASGDAKAEEAVDIFLAMLGCTAGNIALTTGARGGVFIAGGIIPRMLPDLKRSRFRRRFEDKGRFHPYLEAVPIDVIIHAYPAFLGLASLVGGA